jgi:hypothetical protein
MERTTSEAPPAPVGRARRSRWGALRKVGPTTVGLIALVSSAIALTFTLFPRLAPDPGTNYRAQVSVFAIEHRVTYGEYLHRIAFTPAHYRARRAEALKDTSPDARAGVLRAPGDLVYVSSTVEGFKHGSVSLRWSLYDARTGTRVPGPDFSDAPAADLDLDAPTDRTMQLVWIPPPPGPGWYFVRVGLYDDNDTPLDIADSRRFRGP